jgi:hypothetical protein
MEQFNKFKRKLKKGIRFLMVMWDLSSPWDFQGEVPISQ